MSELYKEKEKQLIYPFLGAKAPLGLASVRGEMSTQKTFKS